MVEAKNNVGPGETATAAVEVSREGDTFRLQLSGRWQVGAGLPDFGRRAAPHLKGDGGGGARVAVDASGLGSWDSTLIVFLLNCRHHCEAEGLTLDLSGLPENLRALIGLATAVPEKEDARRGGAPDHFIARLGEAAIRTYHGTLEAVAFLGECTVSLAGIFTGRTRLRWRDFFLILQECGVAALPIVTLISFMVGLIIAFLGAVVLLRFGAGIYVSYLVGYGMFREMGALMVGIIMAGRTGAAFAAEIGSMKVSEEIDALKTLGISEIDFIVTPRLIALFLMIPFLTVYADAVGIASGYLVSDLMMDISQEQFFNGMKEAVGMSDMLLGVVKGTVFGGIIAYTGCLRGMQCGSSADAVGLATTSAVVTGITLIICANALIDWIAAVNDF